MIQAVLFDMDGLMLDTERMWAEVWLQEGLAAGLPMTEQVVVSMRGCNGEGCRRVCRAAFGPEFDFDSFQDRARAAMQAMVERRGLAVKPGLVPLLQELRRRGIPAVVATSTRRATTRGYLQKTGIEGLFRGLVCGDEVTKGKPDPEIFLKAARLAGVPPQNCMVLEDSPNGIRAGAAAGCKAVMVPDLTAPDAQLRALAAAVVPSLYEAIALLDTL